MKKFRLSTPALNRLLEIGEYTERQWGVRQRDKYLDELDACFSMLACAPNKGRPRDDLTQGLRCYRLNKHFVFFFVADNRILIADILHESMDISAHMERWTKGS
jgi:toxin ParE1/3/4